MIGLLVFSPTLREPIPFYPTRPKVYKQLSDIVAERKIQRCVDLGSGFGSVLFALAPTFPETTFIGYEIGIFPLTVAWVRSWWHPNVRFIRKSLWDADLESFDCIYAFLSPPPMAALEEKLLKEMSPSATFITNSFQLPNSQPNFVVTIGGQSLLIYRRCDIGGYRENHFNQASPI
jgi:SAM-dependent methyltransferase